MKERLKNIQRIWKNSWSTQTESPLKTYKVDKHSSYYLIMMLEWGCEEIIKKIVLLTEIANYYWK